MNHVSIDIFHDGTLHDLSVIGYRGKFDSSITPTTREVVYMNRERRIVELIDPRFLESRAMPVVGEFRSPHLLKNEIPVGVNRLGPWPAKFGYKLLAIGAPEIYHAHELLRQIKREHSKSFKLLMASLVDPEIPVSDLAIERHDATIIIYAEKRYIDLVLHFIRNVAEQVMIRAHQNKDNALLIKASWWLSRAAVITENDQDIYLAAAGLRSAGSPDWKTLLEYGRKRHSESSQVTRLERAVYKLDTGK